MALSFKRGISTKRASQIRSGLRVGKIIGNLYIESSMVAIEGDAGSAHIMRMVAKAISDASLSKDYPPIMRSAVIRSLNSYLDRLEKTIADIDRTLAHSDTRSYINE